MGNCSTATAEFGGRSPAELPYRSASFYVRSLSSSRVSEKLGTKVFMK